MSDAVVIKMSSGLREGQDIIWEDLQKAVKQLWALGLFSDIRIIQDRQIRDGVYLNIQVEELPRFEKLVVEGNKKIKTEEIQSDVGFFRGQVLNPNHIITAKKKLLRLYEEKGYTLAQIEAKTFKSETEGKAVLHLNINEGRKVQIQQIRFFGNAVIPDGKLRRQMKKTKVNHWWGGGDFDKEEFGNDKRKVLEYYRNQGYRDAEIVKDSLYYDIENKDMFIDIWVREGQCYYFGDISWDGVTLFEVKQMNALLEFEKGDVFSEEKFIKSIQDKIGGAYYDLGYIYAQINPVETLRGEDTLDVHFIINEKDPVTIRKILIVGNDRTKERVIRRSLKIRPGDVFSRELLMRSHRELMMLNYFSTVLPEVIPNPQSEEELDLSFNVEERSTDTANLSAGWSELDRLIGSIGLGMNNLFGNGQQLSLDWNFGRYYRSFSLGFTEPWFLSTPTLIGVSVYDTKRDPFYIGYRQRSRGFSIRLGRRFTWPDNYFRGDWIYRLDETELSDFNEFYQDLNPNNIVNEDWPLTSSGITQIITRNSIDHPEFPTEGSRVSLSTEITGGFLGGNVAYHKHIFSAEFFVKTFTSKLVLLARTSAGYMDKLTKDGKIQYINYFFMGGSGMSRSIPLRGYDDPLAGGRYVSSGAVGGKTMLKATAELRFPILSQPLLYGLVFAEAGNTWEDLKSTDPFDLRRAVGVGARIFMPMVGMLGFDYAYGFDYYDATGRRYGLWKTGFVFGQGGQ
jgi:outer membrane protein insertion porin family